MNRAALDLQVGDRIHSHGTTVTVLRPREPWEDPFGRAFFRYWCRREDTNAEGWMTYGPGGTVEVAA